MAEPKNIYCPLCGRKVSVWDGKRTINIVEKCYKCKKSIIFDVEKRKTKIRSMRKSFLSHTQKVQKALKRLKVKYY